MSPHAPPLRAWGGPAAAMLKAAAFSLALLAGVAFAQAAQPGQGADAKPGPAAGKVVPSDEVPSGQGTGGIQGQNIFDVKPEVKRDASSEPGYDKQTNGQRNRVQPGNNAPMWRDVQAGKPGYSSLPASEAPEAGVLIQPPVQYPGSRMTTAGEAWRQVRNQWIIPYGGSLILIVLVAIGIWYFTRGAVGHSPADSGQGRRIERFTPFERAAHWTNAIAFVILMVSGIVMAFGKAFLLPVMGQALFGLLTYVLKNLHNFAGPLFAVSLAVMFVTFVRDNFPQRGDLRWLLHFGGMASKSGHELPSWRFNAAEKIVFWGGVLFLGSVVVASGLVLDKLIPSLVYVRETMQVAHMVHASAAVLMICVFIGHIYIGTIGMRGAYTAMRRGWVDEGWAKEHHEYWYDEIKAGRIPAVRSQPSAVAAPDRTAKPA